MILEEELSQVCDPRVVFLPVWSTPQVVPPEYRIYEKNSLSLSRASETTQAT